MSLSFFFLNSSHVKASGCSNMETLICEVEAHLSLGQRELCVANTLLGQYFSNKPQSFPGSCADFQLKKIKTFACNAGLKFSPYSPKPELLMDPSLNYFSFGITEYNDQMTSDELPFIKKSLNASTTAEYAQASAKSGTHMIEDGSQLQFQLGSEVYGAQYFVDLCILNKNLNPERFDLKMIGKILFTQSLFSQPSYIQEAQVLSKIELICQTGTQTQVKVLSSESPFLSAEKTYSTIVTPSSQCFIRHSFKESALEKNRSNKFKKISFQTQLNLSPEDETLLQPIPKKYCLIKKNGNNKFLCQEVSIPSSEDLIEQALSGQFFTTDTYTGNCPNPCKLK